MSTWTGATRIHLSFFSQSPDPLPKSSTFSSLDEFPLPVEPVRVFVGVTITLTAAFFDCPLPATSMPCSNATLGKSPMECMWIKASGGGEVRLIGKALQPTLGNPFTNFVYQFPVIFRSVNSSV
jgi:hypothetical protein